MKPYLLAYKTDSITEDELLDFVDNRKEIVNWITVFPGTMLLATKLNATSLARRISRQFPKLIFIATLIDVDPAKINGLVYSNVWDFIQDPEKIDDTTI